MIKIFHMEAVLEIIITSLAKEVMFLIALVCLFVCLFVCWWTTLLKKVMNRLG